MWADIRQIVESRIVHLMFVLFCAALVYGIAAFGDYVVYATSRYVLASGSWFSHILMWWRFAFFAVVAAWIYRESR